ncbi:PREDICTED: uncharacterized protein LOC104588954 [Nelumbo nucifera]|uniref:Uncharacterized protein LOC104588954 n=1 Tax=Nelumbo nucifera TaxID=4432 RepID=A0A1U7Z3S7_NELNU|nr:PREDICTED: uncharacterized protein LOC104588954 [Nelumbo nucifera]
MPTFPAIALERLLEPSPRDPPRTTSLSLKQDNCNNKNGNSNADRTINGSDAKKPPPRHIYITPALYTTPEPAPIPVSSSASISPSPYVVNRKRRDLRVPDAVSRLDGFEIRQKPKEEGDSGGLGGGGKSSLVKPVGEVSINDPLVEIEEEGEEMKQEGCESLTNVEIAAGVQVLDEGSAAVSNDACDDFFDPRDSMSVASCSETEDVQQLAGRHTPVANQSVFYDADEEFFSDGSISNASPYLCRNIEAELCDARVNLFEEIERRKKAEDALSQMRNQWLRIRKHLSQAGLSVPVNLDAENNMQLEVDVAEQLCQEVVIARYVSEAVGRGQARAETEAIAEALIKSKNQEISRLQDRLQYYETVNHEMSQRNQEEIARRKQYRRKMQRRWIWSCVGMSIILGTSMLAYKCLPHAKNHLALTLSDFSDSSLNTKKPT